MKFIFPIIFLMPLVSLGQQEQESYFRINNDDTKYKDLKIFDSYKYPITKLTLWSINDSKIIDTLSTKLSELDTLILDYCGESVVKKIDILHKLKKLELSHCTGEIPSSICKLKQLEYLILDWFDCINCKRTFPKEMRQMTSLKYLELYDGEYKLPDLPNLEGLKINYGTFEKFPKKIYDYKNLKVLIIINTNRFKVPKDEFIKSKLKQITSISIETL